ncbi:MAG: beta-lactamase family protein [Acidimicrobiales bacterium]|nr:beta-lactamase family protein [Acidimicrobiales bacterium]
MSPRFVLPTLPGVPTLPGFLAASWPAGAVGTHVARVVRVPGDVDDLVTRGAETTTDVDVERLWSRVLDLYRSGVHPGIQLCVRHRGDVVLDRAVGHARGVRPGRRLDHPDAVPMGIDTPVNLFSAGKAVTAMVMHKLEEQGALTLDDPVVAHLPAFGRHGKHEITLRQVLTHRAGIPVLPPEAFDLDLLADHDRIEALVCDLVPAAPPGGPPAYHAVSGGLVLEAVTRRVTGRSLRDVLRDEVKEPLGLEWFDYGVGPDDTHRVAHNIITGLPNLPPLGWAIERALGVGWDRAVRLSNDPRFAQAVIPSANVVVTARDTAAFYECLLRGGELDGVRVFDADTVARALVAEAEGLIPDRMLGMPLRYSAGFMLGTSSISLYGWNHPRAFGHLGLANSFTWADPDSELVVALLTTGKAILGSHAVALVLLLGEIYRVFPAVTPGAGVDPAGR